MIELKIGRYTYTISDKDRFLDNGSCVQLVTQTEPKLTGYNCLFLVLTKKALKEISKYKKIIVKSNYPEYCTHYKLDFTEEN